MSVSKDATYDTTMLLFDIEDNECAKEQQPELLYTSQAAPTTPRVNQQDCKMTTLLQAQYALQLGVSWA